MYDLPLPLSMLPQLGCGGWNTEAQEAESSLYQNDVGNVNGEQNDCCWQDVGEDVLDEDSRHGAADGLSRFHEHILFHRESGTAVDPRVYNSEVQPENYDHCHDTWPDYGDDHHEDDEARKRHPSVNDTLHEKVEQSPIVRGYDSNSQGEDRRQGGRTEPD